MKSKMIFFSTANIFPSPSQAFGPVPWGTPMPLHGKPFYPGSYPGNMPFGSTVPVGTHNQFIPLQVSLIAATEWCVYIYIIIFP